MSAPNNIDFVKGKDFTLEPSLIAADLHLLIEDAQPYDETDPLEGKGLVIVTKDTALDTPEVPDAAIVVKWKRYLWVRIPYSTADDTTPIIYTWDDALETPDATLVNWVEAADTTTIETALTALTVRVNTAEGEIINNAATINAVNAIATQASEDATAALEVADSITGIQSDVITLQAADVTINTRIDAVNATAVAALAGTTNITVDQLSDTLDLSAKDVTLNPLTGGNLESTALTVIASGQTIISHGLNTVPTRMRLVFVKVGVPGADEWPTDSEISAESLDGSSSSSAFSIGATSDNIIIVINATYFPRVLRYSDGSFLAGSYGYDVNSPDWKLKVYYGL